eukprot:jgi/Picsp_1/1264/NSC_04745-R1_vacuolar fusion protein mon1 homolog a-like
MNSDQSYSVPGLLREHKKVAFIFSSAGKPIYCYGVDEERMTDVMAAAQAIISVGKSLGDPLRSMRSSNRAVYFLDRSPLSLVSVSQLGEPLAVLRMQLVLLHSQIVFLLTAKAVTSIFDRYPGYDLRRLIQSSEHVTSKLFESFTDSPGTFLGAFPSCPMQQESRGRMDASMGDALVACGAEYGILVANGRVVSTKSKGTIKLQQWDVILVLNFLASNESLRHSETVMTICLPFYDSSCNFIAYTKYIDDEACLLFLSSDAVDNVTLFSAVCDSMATEWVHCSKQIIDIDSLTPSLDEATLQLANNELIFVFKDSQKQQYVWNGPKENLQLSTEEVIVKFSNMRAGMFAHDGEYPVGPLQTFRLEEVGEYTFIAICSTKYEFFVAIDSLASTQDAVETVENVNSVLIDHSSLLFS